MRVKFAPRQEDLCKRVISKRGKTYVAKKYGVTLASVTGWCKRVGFEPPKYAGLVRHDVNKKSSDIVNLYKTGHSLEFIAKLYDTSRPKIVRILRTEDVFIKNSFDEWSKQRKFIEENLDFYIKANRDGLTLMDIANNYDISYEQLKRVFKEQDIDIALHSYNKSNGELEIKEWLNEITDGNFVSIKKTYNDKQYEIDCYSDQFKFGIEYCGEFWHSYNNGISKGYHYDKYAWAKEQNIQLMTIFEHEWYSKKTLIKSMIKHRIGMCENKIYARNTNISIIPNSVAKLFHDLNHINGGLRTSSVNIGLFYDNEIISVISFSKSRFAKEAEYEILRYSSKMDYTIVGGFSKMMKYFMKLHDYPSVVTYSDLRFGEGRTYLKNGFEFVSITPPNYWYYYKNDGISGKLESRIKYQKHKLSHFDNFSYDKTEYDIMAENGYLKLYDCGNAKYIHK